MRETFGWCNSVSAGVTACRRTRCSARSQGVLAGRNSPKGKATPEMRQAAQDAINQRLAEQEEECARAKVKVKPMPKPRPVYRPEHDLAYFPQSVWRKFLRSQKCHINRWQFQLDIRTGAFWRLVWGRSAPTSCSVEAWLPAAQFLGHMWQLDAAGRRERHG